MNARTKDKIKDIEQYLDELSDIVPETFKEYSKDKKTKAACERYAEKIIEGVVDLAFLIIKDKKLPLPEDDKEAFEILESAGIIERRLASRLKEAKGMRNVLAHQYGNVDDKLVFMAIKKEIDKDVRQFVKIIKENLKA